MSRVSCVSRDSRDSRNSHDSRVSRVSRVLDVTHGRAVGQVCNRRAACTAQAKLVSHDISPTDCINAIFKDNVGAASQVSEDVVRQFVRIAGSEKAPRYIRFLKTILGPPDNPIKRSQILVMQHISQNRRLLSLSTCHVVRYMLHSQHVLRLVTLYPRTYYSLLTTHYLPRTT